MQHVKEPTHVRGHTLDVVITRDTVDTVSNVVVTDPDFQSAQETFLKTIMPSSLMQEHQNQLRNDNTGKITITSDDLSISLDCVDIRAGGLLSYDIVFEPDLRLLDQVSTATIGQPRQVDKYG
ncbi:hypothetical protein DPMN_060809 [Dreissena polymorpha]|uniref:Uncharacterized protein n=1 Tax=Dreissena polymorpha TaxID=45954 RepID=A0A9D4C6F5_DREPO|nr:hypothetical protein DPMN_060809 [Dreissena polymorpha]